MAARGQPRSCSTPEHPLPPPPQGGLLRVLPWGNGLFVGESAFGPHRREVQSVYRLSARYSVLAREEPGPREGPRPVPASERYLLPRLMTSFIRRFFSSISSRVRPFFIRLRSSRSSGVIAASASRRLALERLAASSRLFLGGPKTTILSRFLRDLYHSRSLRWSVKVF